MSIRSGLQAGSDCSVDEFLFIIWTFVGPSKDDVDVFIAASLDNCSHTIIRHTHKGMRIGRRAHRIDGDRYGAICTIFETCMPIIGELHSNKELIPMGKETPLASSRWSCDSVVRAPGIV
jgi:hypothetical protein